MPTNLPAEAIDAEKRYRAAESTAEKIACLEELLSYIPKHKGTDRLRSDHRRRLSKLKAEAKTRKGTGKRESPFRISKEGPGQVVLVGPPNTGKSALVATLTNATPKVSRAPFTTWVPMPGMMPIDDIQVQLVDTPPLHRDHVEPELTDMIRRADLILLVVDLQTYPIRQLEDTIALLEAYRIVPLHLKERYAEQERLTFVPLLVLVNKCDDESFDEDCEILSELLEGEWPLIPVSATTGRNLERMKQAVFESLEIIRIYSKPPGKPADMSAPYVMKRGSTIGELARKVHKDFSENLKTARVWGTGVHFGQMVGRDHVLHDGDIVELRI